jgi:hypothetical protein
MSQLIIGTMSPPPAISNAPPGQKIALNVHDDQRIVAMKPHGHVPCPPVPQPPLITGERVKGKTLY